MWLYFAFWHSEYKKAPKISFSPPSWTISIIDVITFYLSGTFWMYTHTHIHMVLHYTVIRSKIKINLLTFLDWLNIEHWTHCNTIEDPFSIRFMRFFFFFLFHFQMVMPNEIWALFFIQTPMTKIWSKRGNLLFGFWFFFGSIYFFFFVVNRFIDKKSVEITNKSGIFLKWNPILFIGWHS